MKNSKLPQSTDARIWADEFCKYFKNIYGYEVDKDWMITWFSNAIMAGYDERSKQMRYEEKRKDKQIVA